MNRSITLTLTLCVLTAQSAFGALNVDVTGVLGSGQTTWTFSGSYDTTFTNENDGVISFNGTQTTSSSINNFSHTTGDLSGEYTADSAHNSAGFGITSGGATITGSLTGIHNIDGLRLDSDGAVGADDFSWYADGVFDQTQTLTFQGSVVISADIGTFGEDATLITSLGDSFSVSSTSEVTPLTMTFTAVPEPSSFALLIGMGAAGFCSRRRRVKWA